MEVDIEGCVCVGGGPMCQIVFTGGNNVGIRGGQMGCGGEKSISCIFKVVHILALTYYVNRGWIANEVFRRVHPEGSTIGSFVREKISKEFGARVFVGVHDAEMSDYAPVAEVISESIFSQCQYKCKINVSFFPQGEGLLFVWAELETQIPWPRC